MRWSPPGSRACVLLALIRMPPCFCRMTILPSFMAISCSSIGDSEVVALVTVTSVSPSLTRVPKAAVMPLSAAFTHGSRMPSTPASGLAEADADGPACAVDGESDEPQPATPTVRIAATRTAAERRREAFGLVVRMCSSSDGCCWEVGRPQLGESSGLRER